ncbi:MAG: anti-sigma factor antagonist [Lachnospiraceae bacterium]|nr:anti-sigma factor antagonist [Lachnospiraceae bacterium]
MNRIRETEDLPVFDWDEKTKTAVFTVSGELDHYAARGVREEIDRMISRYRPRTAVLDLHAVSFMDSAGIGLILGRYDRVSGYGGTLTVRNPTREILKMLNLAGMERIIRIEINEERKNDDENKGANGK